MGELWFFGSRAEALAYPCNNRVDVVGRHEEYLGQVIPSILSKSTEWISAMGGICFHLLDSLWSGQGTIRATMNGSAGDCGLYSNLSVLTCPPGAARNRLLSDERMYRQALRSREVVRQKSATTISHAPPLMAMFLGLDNRQILPPFLPFSRNEDGMFALMLSMCCEDAYCGHLPFTLDHTPSGLRAYPGDGITDFRACDIISAVLASFSAGPVRKSVCDRLTAVGSYLAEIASMSGADFVELLRIALINRTVVMISELESIVSKVQHAEVKFWINDVRGQIAALEGRLGGSAEIVVADVREDSSERGRMTQMQNMIGLYAQMLKGWPALVSAAGACAESHRQQIN